MLTFVSFAWRQPGYHTTYTSARVNSWAAMIRANYQGPARFVAVTDDSEGLSRDVEAVPLWPDHAELGNPHGANYPNCHRRLRLFAEDAAELVGADRFVVMDLDVVATGDLTPLFERREDFVAWQDPMAPKQSYNGGLWMLRAGTRADVWSRFKGASSIADTRAAGFVGSDQAWMGYAMGRSEAVWTPGDGVVSYKRDIITRGVSPLSCRLVLFHGRVGPWDKEAPEWARRWFV